MVSCVVAFGLDSTFGVASAGGVIAVCAAVDSGAAVGSCSVRGFPGVAEEPKEQARLVMRATPMMKRIVDLFLLIVISSLVSISVCGF
jgi:hypothetical protein